MSKHHDQREALHEARRDVRHPPQGVRDITRTRFTVEWVVDRWFAFDSNGERLGEGCTPTSAMIAAEGKVRGWHRG